MAKNFEVLRAKMSPEARALSEKKAKMYLRRMALDELREAQNMTQQKLAKKLHVSQAAISKMERRTDMYVSTLQSMVKALGGNLEIRAVFPKGTIEVNQFSDLNKH